METSTTVVTGASRGFGRALATALVERGRHVVGVARDAHDLAEVRAELGAQVDVRQAFQWLRASLTEPLEPGSTVVSFSSGAAIQGSPLSGGYAGAKATVRFLTSYAAEESARLGLGIRFTSVLPRLTPATGLGAAAVAAYADRAGLEVADFLDRLGPPTLPATLAADLVDLLAHPSLASAAYTAQPTGGLVPLA